MRLYEIIKIPESEDPEFVQLINSPGYQEEIYNLAKYAIKNRLVDYADDADEYNPNVYDEYEMQADAVIEKWLITKGFFDRPGWVDKIRSDFDFEIERVGNQSYMDQADNVLSSLRDLDKKS